MARRSTRVSATGEASEEYFSDSSIDSPPKDQAELFEEEEQDPDLACEQPRRVKYELVLKITGEDGNTQP